MGKLTYPASTTSRLLINTGRSATGNRAGTVRVNGSELTGSVTAGGFCGSSKTYQIYFDIRFDRAPTGFGTWSGGTVTDGSANASGTNTGAYVTFDTTQQRHGPVQGRPVLRQRRGRPGQRDRREQRLGLRRRPRRGRRLLEPDAQPAPGLRRQRHRPAEVLHRAVPRAPEPQHLQRRQRRLPGVRQRRAHTRPGRSTRTTPAGTSTAPGRRSSR